MAKKTLKQVRRRVGRTSRQVTKLTQAARFLQQRMGQTDLVAAQVGALVSILDTVITVLETDLGCKDIKQRITENANKLVKEWATPSKANAEAPPQK